MRKNPLISALTLTVLAVPALAHEGDIAVGNFGGVLMTGLGDDVAGTSDFPWRVFGAELIDQGGVVFTDEPGLLGPFGDGFAPGTGIGFNVLKAVRSWNGTDFNNISSVGMNISLGSFSVDAPATDIFTPGFDIVSDASVDFDEHGFFTLSTNQTGIYLLEMEITADGFDASDAIWVVFNYGLDEEDHEVAIEWVEENLVPAPGALGVLAAAGLLGVRRRRN